MIGSNCKLLWLSKSQITSPVSQGVFGYQHHLLTLNKTTNLCVCGPDILQDPQCTKAAVFTPDKAKGCHLCIGPYATNELFFRVSHWVNWNFDQMFCMFILSLDMDRTFWVIPQSPDSIHETITLENWKALIPDGQEGSLSAECRTSLESSL